MAEIVQEPTNAGMLGESSGLADTNSTMSESEESEESGEEITDVSMFGETSGLADVVLIIENTRIPVVKAVLSIASPVFGAMFTGDFAEKSQKKIKLPEKKLESFLMFLRCIYPDQKVHVTDDTALSILPLASEYQVENLIEACEECLVQFIRRKIKSKQSISCNETCIYLKVAEEFALEELKNVCIGWASNFKLNEREAAIQDNIISAESEKVISTIAFKRHELYEKDVSLLTTEQNLRELFTPSVFPYNPNPNPNLKEDKQTVTSKLRLAYKILGRRSKEYKQQVTKAKEHFKAKSYRGNMPEDIIQDLCAEDE